MKTILLTILKVGLQRGEANLVNLPRCGIELLLWFSRFKDTAEVAVPPIITRAGVPHPILFHADTRRKTPILWLSRSPIEVSSVISIVYVSPNATHYITYTNPNTISRSIFILYNVWKGFMDKRCSYCSLTG